MKKVFLTLAVVAIAASAHADLLLGFDVSGLAGGNGNFGSSPFGATTVGTNIISVTADGLTRGAGVTTSGTAAARAWGGTGWTGEATDTVTFSLTAAAGFTMSLTTLNLDYRRSSAGAPSGTLLYSLDGGSFTSISALTYSATSSSGGSISPVDLSSVAALQNVASGVKVTFQILNDAGSASSGTWYIYDKSSSSASDLSITGTTLTAVPEPREYGVVLAVMLAALVVMRRRRAAHAA